MTFMDVGRESITMMLVAIRYVLYKSLSRNMEGYVASITTLFTALFVLHVLIFCLPYSRFPPTAIPSAPILPTSPPFVASSSQNSQSPSPPASPFRMSSPRSRKISSTVVG